MKLLSIFCFSILLSACGDPEKVLKDVTYNELKDLNMEYFSNIDAFARDYQLRVIRIHNGDSCSYGQFLFKIKENNTIEFEKDSTWYALDELCMYYPCKEYNMSSERIIAICNFMQKYNVEIQTSCELDRLYFSGKGYKYIYYNHDTIPLMKEWKRMSNKWWFSKDSIKAND